jgi:hypothetical protein
MGMCLYFLTPKITTTGKMVCPKKNKIGTFESIKK